MFWLANYRFFRLLFFKNGKGIVFARKTVFTSTLLNTVLLKAYFPTKQSGIV